MATAWGGADPVETADPNDYELGIEYRANQDLTISHVRVWTGAGEIDVPSRHARIWSAVGAQLGIATLPSNLPAGWSSHALDEPVERLAGQRFLVSYSTGGNYGALPGALAADVSSEDAAVTALSSTNATSGNGRFSTTPALLPDVASGSSAFYGVDFAYALGSGGNTAPRITALAIAVDDADVTATATVEDNETLVGAVYRFDWGDGSPVTVSATPSSEHTYAASADYAVLVAAVDAQGGTDYRAAVARVRIPVTGGPIAEAAAILADAARDVPGVRIYTDPGANTDPPAVVVGPPVLAWEAQCLDPSSARFTVYLMVPADERAMERLWDLVPQLADQFDRLADAAVTGAVPFIFNAAGVDLPAYAITVEVGL